MLSQETRERIKRETAGLDEDAALTAVAKVIRPDIVRSKVMVMRQPVERGELFFTDLTKRRSHAASLTDADRELIRKSGFTEAEVLANMPARRERSDGPLVLTAEDEAELRRRGIDPRLIERIGGVHSAADYRRVKDEIGGAA